MKKNLTLSKLMMVVIMAILPLTFYAQKNQSQPVERYFYINAEGGLSINHTDLANYGFIPFYQDLNLDGKNEFVFNDGYVFKNYNGMVGLGYQIGKVIGVNGKFGTGTLSGEKHFQFLQQNGLDPALVRYRQDLKLDKTTFMEGNLNLTFNLNNLFFGYNPRRVFNFIPHVGIGAIGYKAGAVTKTDPTVIPTANSPFPLAAKTDREWTYTIPVGAELNFNVARKLDIYLDYTYTFAGNDKLDQVEKVFEDYVDNTTTISARRVDDIAIIKDMYSHLNLGLRFKFNSPCDIEKMARNADQITYTVNPDPLMEENGKVCFDVIFNVPANYFEKDAVMNITPTLNTKNGAIDLEPVTFVGQRVKGQGDFQVNYSQGGEFTKNYCLDYTPAMETSTLTAKPMFYVYDGTIYPTQEDIVKNVYYTQGGEKKIADGVKHEVIPTCDVKNIKTKVENNTITVTWTGDAESFNVFLGEDEASAKYKVTDVKGNSYTFEDVEVGDYKAFVKAVCGDDLSSNYQPASNIAQITPERKPIAVFYFDYQSAKLKTNTAKNKIALKAIADAIASGEKINGFEIEGWASPENGDNNNNQLSSDRADAAVKAIKNQLKKDAKDYTFDATGFGSDWNLFMDLVQKSNLKDKDQIIRVINNAGSQAKKEQEIKNMINVYPELEKDILPLIRRAEVYLK